MGLISTSNSVSAIVGAISGALALFTSAYLYPEVALKRLNSKINIEKLRPKFDLKYYSIPSSGPMFYNLYIGKQEGDEKFIHPVFESIEIGRSGNTGFVIDYFGANDEDLFQGIGLNVKENENALCSYWYFYFKFNGGYAIEDVKIFFHIENAKENFEEVMYFLNVDGDYSKKDEKKFAEIGNIEVNSQYKIPIAIECGVSDNSVADGEESVKYFTYKKLAFPVEISYFDPLLKQYASIPVRKLLRNTLVDSTGVETRG